LLLPLFLLMLLPVKGQRPILYSVWDASYRSVCSLAA